MNEKDLKDYILLQKSDYETLIEYKQKAEQYKTYILKNMNNQRLTNAMTIIEKKGLYDILKESEEKE